MTTPTRVAKIVERFGFERHDAPGFVGWHRTHPEDGRKQLLHVFFWSNAKHAEAAGIPHAYIVVVPTIDSDTLPSDEDYVRHEDARFIIPTKDRRGQVIPWDLVAPMFEDTVIPIFETPVEVGRVLVREAVESNPL